MQMAPITVVGGLVGRIKSSGILLGICYLTAFVLMLPYAGLLAGWAGVGGAFKIALAAAVAVAGVGILLNWLYVALAVAPIAASIVLVLGGWAVWVGAPLLGIVIDSIVKLVLGFATLGTQTSALDPVVGYGIDFVTRIGQTMIALGGCTWWVVRKLGSANYIALGTFAAGIALMGAMSGVAGLGGVAVFLLVWLVIYMKVRKDENIPDLRRLFQVVASLAVLSGTQLLSLASIAAPLSHLAIAGAPGVASSGPSTLGNVYKVCLALLMVWGIWRPQDAWSVVPAKVRVLLTAWFGDMQALVFRGE